MILMIGLPSVVAPSDGKRAKAEGSSDANAPAGRQIIRSLTPGYITAIPFPAVLSCPGSIALLMPERETRTVVQGGATVDCLARGQGRLAACKAVTVEPPGRFFELSAPRMAQACDLSVAEPEGQIVRLEFVFETRVG